MDSAISSEWTVRVAFAVGCLLLFFTVFLFATVFLLRLSLLDLRKRQLAFSTYWAPIWNQCFSNEWPENVPKLKDIDAITFLIQWIQYHETYEESLQEILNYVARKAGLEKCLFKILKHNNVREKILAITAFGFLQDKKHWNMLHRYISSPTTSISISAARALLKIDAEKSMPILMEQLKTREDWPQARVILFLAEAGIDTVSKPLATAINTSSTSVVPKLVRYLEIASSSIALPTMKDLLKRSNDKQIMLACLTTLMKFNINDDLELIRRFLSHTDWEIRAATAKLLGKAGMPQDEAYLIALLNDSNNIVQYEAAHALLRMPHFTLAHCLKVQQSLEGTAGNRMLTRVITEKQLRA